MDKIQFKSRLLMPVLMKQLKRGKSVLLLGPRQTGKTTLLKRLKFDLYFDLLNISTRQLYERDPEALIREIEDFDEQKGRIPLVIIDEIQKIPTLMDPIQSIIDQNKAQFILTGSSARKLRRHSEINLLPGRVVLLRLDSFCLGEISVKDITDVLAYGSLPGIFQTLDPQDKDLDLKSYVETYLEQEIRQEAATRNIGAFARFLELAGLESGNTLNYSKIAQDIGVRVNTLKGYFEILFDTLIAERISPITESETRKKLTKTDRFLFFDLGVRRICAKEGVQMTPERKGQIFEQFVGLELIHQLRLYYPNSFLKFWKDPDGPEVDWIIETTSEWIPIEVKFSKNPKPSDAKHLKVFLNEYNQRARRGFIICNCSRPQKIADNIRAIPLGMIQNLSFLNK